MPVFTVTGDVDPFLHVSMARGETIYCESGAMVMMESNLDLKGKMKGGLGAALMHGAEDMARACNKKLLVLDTATGSEAERLYARLGWERVGVIPNYAHWPDGALCGTTYFYKAMD